MPVTFLKVLRTYIETKTQSGDIYRIAHIASDREGLLAKTTQRRDYKEISSECTILYIHLMSQQKEREITPLDIQREVEKGIEKLIKNIN